MILDAAVVACPYKREGYIDDDCDDGTASLMPRMSQMTQKKGL